MEWYLNAYAWLLPAMLGNAAPAVMAKLNVLGLNRPLDFGKIAPDGKRWLGDGKTIQGYLVAMLIGALTGQVLSYWGLSSLALGALLGLSAMLGDTAGSFIKRRKGMKRGANAGVLERIDFIVAGIIVTWPVYAWQLKQIVLLLVTMPLVHRTANIIGYRLGLKDVPW